MTFVYTPSTVEGVPPGGTTGQALIKASGNNYDTEWGTVSGGGVSDGDKGDITVSGSGATWTIDNGAVSLAKMADMATASVIYRKTAGTGAPEVQSLATLKADLGLSGTNTGDQDLSGYATTAAVAAGYQPLDSDLTAIAALTTTSFGRSALTLADAAAGRTLFGLGTAAVAATSDFAAASQTEEMIAGFIASPSDKSYTIVLKMAHAGTITETTTKSGSGTCTATFKINSTALGGAANSVSSVEQSQTHSGTNTFAAGDDIVLTVSANSSCADMSFSIKYTRTLA